MTIHTLMDVIRGKDTWIRKDVKKELVHMGNDYGGFELVKEYLNDGMIVYSFGIGEDLSFSKDLLSAYSVNIYAFDPTPKAINYVQKNMSDKRFQFYPYGLAEYDGKTEFFLPENDEYVSGSSISRKELKSKGIEVEMRRLLSLMKMLQHEAIDLLKIDIEGSEFAVISNILEENISIRQICVEVHQRFFCDGGKKMKKLMGQLHEKGYQCAYVSSNHELLTFINTNWEE